MELGADGWNMYSVEPDTSKKIMTSKEADIDLDLEEGAKNPIYWFKNKDDIRYSIKRLRKLGSTKYEEFMKRADDIEKDHQESSKTIKDMPEEILRLMMDFQNTDDWARFLATSIDDLDLRDKMLGAAQDRRRKECPKFIQEKKGELEYQPREFCLSEDPMYRVCKHFAEECNTLYSIDQEEIVKIDERPGAYKVVDGITTIGPNAFLQKNNEWEGNIYMKSIILPDSVTKIDDLAFNNCEGLESITLPESVTEIGRWAFSACRRLKSITLPDSVTEIGDYAFQHCDGLETITLSNSVTTIPKGAFKFCVRMKYFLIPKSVTRIEEEAFHYCADLETITIPDSVTEIAQKAFYHCRGLVSVKLSNSITAIEDDTFKGCSSLTTVTIPDSVTTIGDMAFAGCSSLTTITIPESVTSIALFAFDDCPKLDNAIKAKIDKIIASTQARKEAFRQRLRSIMERIPEI